MARRRNPYPGLIVVALVPALILGGCWRFADGKAPAAVEVTSTDTPAVVEEPVVEPAALTTPLLSVRRSPAVLARDVNLGAFTAEAEAFLPLIDDTSCVALSVDGQMVAGSHAELPLRPASNVKIITAAVALEVLGADHTYTTEVRGTAEGGVVAGDLYLVGSGDPLLSSSWWNGPNAKYPPFNVTSIETLAQNIRHAGVTRIDGSVIGDASRYDDEWYAPSWTDDVRFSEGGPVSALLVNDSREAIDRSSNDPVIGAATVLTEALAAVGVTVAGEPGEGVAPDDAPVVASVTSLPMTAVLQEMLTTSDNNTAEMVLKEIGVKAGGAGTREAGLGVVLSTLQSWGVPTDALVLVDGSGLSDDNRLTCGSLLAVVQHQDIADPIGQGLAVAGQQGGTLSDAFVGTELEGVLRGKTGTLYNYDDGTGGKPAAKSLSGYVPVDGGGAIEFAMLLNGPQVAEKVVYRPIWDAFGDLLLTYPSGPTATELGPR
ncbi:MAG: D-alanyl-D-alanine carboxypeptidase/D-alanyl-D-alanine-endopeptidase [Actinobacteria bacterium]|nr:D-alanyl-D-alanine carboxypeptidase/D-alanyl-D-alanine-endopeptidase [Actinomycetota bacterium]